MAETKSTRGEEWSDADVQQLRELADGNTSTTAPSGPLRSGQPSEL